MVSFSCRPATAVPPEMRTPRLSRPRREQSVGRRPSGALPLDLGLHPGNFGTEQVDALFQFGDRKQFQIFLEGLVQPLPAAHTNVGGFFHRFASLLPMPGPSGRLSKPPSSSQRKFAGVTSMSKTIPQ